MSLLTSTYLNLTRKISGKFLIVFSFCTLTVIGVIWACADSYEPEYSAFAPEYFVNKQYSPFFYTGNEVYYDLGYADNSSIWYNDKIVTEWDGHFDHQLAKASLHYLLITASAGAIDSAYDHYAGSLKTWPAKYPAIKTGKLSNDQVLVFLGYLKLAKACETFTVNQADGWSFEKIKPLNSPVKLEAILLNAFSKQTDLFVKQRLWFQLVRYYYFRDSEAFNLKTVQVFNRYKAQFPNNLTYYRAMGYVAGYYYHRKNYAQANYLYSLCYNYSYDLKIPSFWSFHPQNEQDWKATLQLAKTNDEKITLWHMLGIQFDEARAIKEIAAIDPRSEKLDLLLSRLINIKEAGADAVIPDPARRHRGNNTRLVDSIALKNKTAKPYFWNLAAGYLNFLDSNYTVAGKFYATAKKQLPAGDTLLMAQTKLLDMLLYVSKLKKMDARAEQQLIEPLNWLANLKAEKTKDTKLRYEYALGRCLTAIAKLYHKQGNLIKEVCFSNNDSFYQDSARVESLVNLLNKASKTPFEEVMVHYYPHTAKDLYYHQAIELVYDQQIEKAIAILKKRKHEEFVLEGNPFNSRLNDCHDCDHAAPQKQKFTPLSFLQTLQSMQNEIKGGKNIFRNAFLIANANYNITYYGNGRIFYESDIVGTSPTDGYNGYDTNSAGTDHRDMAIATKYYKLARANAVTDEQKARCTFMLSKCARNEIYNDPSFNNPEKFADIKASQNTLDNYYSYFNELKEKYNKTAYYKEVLKECGYFSIYVNSK